MLKERKAGILMPISSLPSKFGIGTFGNSTKNFILWMKKCGLKVWQILPLLPTGYGDSPYQAVCSNALNYYFIDFDNLVSDGILKKSDYSDIKWSYDIRRVSYGVLFDNKIKVLKIAFNNYDKTSVEWLEFLKEGKFNDFCEFMTLKEYNGWQSRDKWNVCKEYEKNEVADFISKYFDEYLFWQFTQYIALKQWKEIKAFANSNGIEIMGDMPIYLADDSVEMWKSRKLFQTDISGKLKLRAGVPPDVFSADGQFWGNPVYDWDTMKKDGYKWWKNRIKSAFELYDIIRIDHFRAFDRYYAIPEGETTAKNGSWVDGPKAELFEDFSTSNIVAEDLGIIDDSVREMLKETGYPGMKVLSFAYDGNPYNTHKPDYYNENCVVYTGTHDNCPLFGFIKGMTETDKERFKEDVKLSAKYLNVDYEDKNDRMLTQTIVDIALASKSNLAIIPMHDFISADESARINTPSLASGVNWTYRYCYFEFKNSLAEKINRKLKKYRR